MVYAQHAAIGTKGGERNWSNVEIVKPTHEQEQSYLRRYQKRIATAWGMDMEPDEFGQLVPKGGGNRA